MNCSNWKWRSGLPVRYQRTFSEPWFDMNNKQKGVVIFANIGEIARPVIRAITDPNGVPPPEIDLSNPENASLLISAVVDE